MSDERNVREDLGYVRAVVERAESVDSPASIYFLWALISFFGYAIIDFAPEKTGLYWMVAGPLGGIASGVLGSRGQRRAGQVSNQEGLIEFLHWMGLFVGILALIPLVVTGRLDAPELPRVILLLVGLAYWTAGVHLDRRMLPVAAVMLLLYGFTVFWAELPYLWSLTAAGLAGSLAVAGIFAAARARRAAAGRAA
jgi:hypothetical protein